MMRALSKHDRHVLAQDISSYWARPEDGAIAYQAAAEALRILHGENGPGWLRVGAMATVDYLLPSYGKIICVLDAPSGPHTSCCLYDSQEGEHWERVLGDG